METRKIYFTGSENNICTTVTDLPIQHLIELGVIPATSGYLEVSKTTHGDQLDLAYDNEYFDCLEFDNKEHPTRVFINIERACLQALTEMRQNRTRILEQLDHLQFRALCSKKDDVVQQIEADKQRLRDFPSTIDYSSIKTMEDLLLLAPPCLAIDYSYKYKK